MPGAKKRPAPQLRPAGPERTAAPDGGGNQAMLSLLENRGERQSPPASGGDALNAAMRARFERHFGLPMDDVRIHRNSDRPAKFDAGAYTCGSDVFLKPEQEALLDHEMTHVAQQKMGQVRPTGMENGIPVNRSPVLEHSADAGTVPQMMGTASGLVVQCGKKRQKAQRRERKFHDRKDQRTVFQQVEDINRRIRARPQRQSIDNDSKQYLERYLKADTRSLQIVDHQNDEDAQSKKFLETDIKNC